MCFLQTALFLFGEALLELAFLVMFWGAKHILVLVRFNGFGFHNLLQLLRTNCHQNEPEASGAQTTHMHVTASRAQTTNIHVTFPAANHVLPPTIEDARGRYPATVSTVERARSAGPAPIPEGCSLPASDVDI